MPFIQQTLRTHLETVSSWAVPSSTLSPAMSQTHSNYPPPHAPASRLSVAERSRSGSPKYCEIDLKLLWRPNPPKNRPEQSHQCRPSPAQLRERWRALQGEPGSQCSLRRQGERSGGEGEERAGDTTGREASPPRRERDKAQRATGRH